MTSPIIKQKDLQGVIGENVKIESAIVIGLIRINFNQLNKKFIYKKWHLKNIHKFHQPVQVVGAVRGQKSEKEVCNRRTCKCHQFETT
jgi:hypothetical protein